MNLSKQDILTRLKKSIDSDVPDPLIITPHVLSDEELTHSSSIDLHLGTWFVTTRAKNLALIDIYDDKNNVAPAEEKITDKFYIPFGGKFILHPNQFVLAVTLEWVRVPLDTSALITGKSSWGRRGLIVETAPGVHPGFSGCLTLEMTNLGDIAIAIMPGTEICQLFFHDLKTNEDTPCGSKYFGRRQPTLGHISQDDFCKKLSSS